MNHRVKIDFTLVAAGPVLISSGSGNIFNPELPDNTFLTSRNEGKATFVIPGSSLKGVIRHYLYTCNDEKNVDALFGDAIKAGRKSRVSVSDSFADMDTIKTSIRHSTALGSVSQSAKQGSLNNMQAIVGGRFPCCINMKDSDDDEILMLLNAINAINNGEICIGGKISRGFGRMKVEDFHIIISDGYDKETLRPLITGDFNSVETTQTAIKYGLVKSKEVLT